MSKKVSNLPVVKTLLLIVLLFICLKDFNFMGLYPLMYILVSLFPAGWHIINRYYNGGHRKLTHSLTVLHDVFYVGSSVEITAYLFAKCLKLLVSILIGWIAIVIIIFGLFKNGLGFLF